MVLAPAKARITFTSFHLDAAIHPAAAPPTHPLNKFTSVSKPIPLSPSMSHPHSAQLYFPKTSSLAHQILSARGVIGNISTPSTLVKSDWISRFGSSRGLELDCRDPGARVRTVEDAGSRLAVCDFIFLLSCPFLLFGAGCSSRGERGAIYFWRKKIREN